MTLVILGCLAVGSGTGLAGGLISCSPQPAPKTVRPLTDAEARRLADMRVTNYRDGLVALRATLGPVGAETTEVTGLVDWSQELIYLTVGGPGAGEHRGLLQAIPGLLAVRPAKATAASPPPATPTATASATATADPAASAVAPPPVIPPGDGWRIRRLDATNARANPLDAFLALIFAVAHDRPDRPEALARSEARWLGRDRVGDTAVDILLGPAVPQVTWSAGRSSPTPTSLDAMGGAVRYWLDSDARLHRLEALLRDGVPLRVDLDRTARSGVTAVAALGGPPVLPRAVTDKESELLAGIRKANRAQTGATLSLAVPTLPSTTLLTGAGPTVNLRGAGWIDWGDRIAYLALHDLDDPTEAMLLRADPTGVAVRPVSREPTSSDPNRVRNDRTDAHLPPLPPPTERNWAYHEWRERTDPLGGLDVDLLISEALSMGSRVAEDPTRLRRSAIWLRRDTVNGQKVTVFEMPKPAEAGTARGQARLRYWVDPSGVLRRLELRTRTGAFAQLDLSPGRVPHLPWVPTG